MNDSGVVISRALVLWQGLRPVGWGALIECDGNLILKRKPPCHEVSSADRLKLLERIAAAGTRNLNRQLQITFEDVCTARNRSYS